MDQGCHIATTAPCRREPAGTSEGLYVHRLQAVPTIPNYSGGSLTGKWLLTIALSLGVIVLAGVALVVWSRRRPRTEGDKSPT